MTLQINVSISWILQISKIPKSSKLYCWNYCGHRVLQLYSLLTFMVNNMVFYSISWIHRPHIPSMKFNQATSTNFNLVHYYGSTHHVVTSSKLHFASYCGYKVFILCHLCKSHATLGLCQLLPGAPTSMDLKTCITFIQASLRVVLCLQVFQILSFELHKSQLYLVILYTRFQTVFRYVDQK